MKVTTHSSNLSSVRLSPIQELRVKQDKGYKGVEAFNKMNSLWESLDIPDMKKEKRQKNQSVSNIQKFLQNKSKVLGKLNINEPAGDEIKIHETAHYMTNSAMDFYKVANKKKDDRSKTERKLMKASKSLDFKWMR